MGMTVQEDVTALRDAVAALERAAASTARAYAGSVDARRLLVDVERVRQDVDLLCGETDAGPAGAVSSVPSGQAAPDAPRLVVMDDTAYPQDFWMDAEDEGLGGGR